MYSSSVRAIHSVRTFPDYLVDIPGDGAYIMVFFKFHKELECVAQSVTTEPECVTHHWINSFWKNQSSQALT